MPLVKKATEQLRGLLDPCACGATPVVWQIESGPTIRCTACGRSTSNHMTAHDAALAWNLGRVVTA